jgi:hypothetical protein
VAESFPWSLLVHKAGQSDNNWLFSWLTIRRANIIVTPCFRKLTNQQIRSPLPTGSQRPVCPRCYPDIPAPVSAVIKPNVSGNFQPKTKPILMFHEKGKSMTRNRMGQLLIFTLCLLIMAGCSKKATDEIDYGGIVNSVYQNKYFGLNVQLPKEWSVQDQEMRQRLSDTGNKLLAGNDKSMKAVLKASEQQSINLLAAFQHPIGSPVPFNPSIMCTAVRVRNLPGIKHGKDYLYQARKLMESGQMKFEFPKEITTEKLGGVDFDVMHVTMKIGSTTVRQRYYTSIMKGYALNLIVSFTTTEEESLVQRIIDGVTFKTP